MKVVAESASQPTSPSQPISFLAARSINCPRGDHKNFARQGRAMQGTKASCLRVSQPASKRAIRDYHLVLTN